MPCPGRQSLQVKVCELLRFDVTSMCHKDFVDIKLDARNLIEADVKSALTDLDWFGKAGFHIAPLLF